MWCSALPTTVSLTFYSAKQYKEKFKAWGWYKNLPHEKAQWMVQKVNNRKREDCKDTVFLFGGTKWTKERAESSAKRAKTKAPGPDVISEEFLQRELFNRILTLVRRQHTCGNLLQDASGHHCGLSRDRIESKRARESCP